MIVPIERGRAAYGWNNRPVPAINSNDALPEAGTGEADVVYVCMCTSSAGPRPVLYQSPHTLHAYWGQHAADFNNLLYPSFSKCLNMALD